MEIYPVLQALLPDVTAYRQALHRIPEIGRQEKETQQYLWNTLEQWKPDVLTRCADTGVRVVFRTGEKASAVAFRADMDALDVTEQTSCAYASLRPGRMHACGHDGHMATLLGLAAYIAAHRRELAEDVVLLFQPDEESTGGAERMIAQGALENPKVRAVYGMHLMPELPIGTIGWREGPLMAANCNVDFILHGQSAHGAMPHRGVDAIAAATHFYTLLQTTITRCLDPLEPALLTVGKLIAGERRNVLAAEAKLECILRTFDEETLHRLQEGIARDLRAVEVAFGVRTQTDTRVFYPAVCNASCLTLEIRQAAGDALREVKPLMIAEDFSFYQKAVPGVYFFCGCGDAAHTYPLHSDHFDFDTRALLYGMQTFVRLIRWKTRVA